VTFEEYKTHTEKECNAEGSFDTLLNESKDLFARAVRRFKDLEALPAQERSTTVLANAQL